MLPTVMLRRLRPKPLFASLSRPTVAVGLCKPPSAVLAAGTQCGGGCQLELPCRAGQQWRGMAGANNKHKKIIKMAKGFRGRHKNVYKIAIQTVEKSLQMAYRDRKNKRRDFSRMWIQRINAGVRQHGIAYSRFINQAKIADVQLNRKVLSEMAVTEPYSFRAVVETVKAKGGSPPPEGQSIALDFDAAAMVELDDLDIEDGEDDDDQDEKLVRDAMAKLELEEEDEIAEDPASSPAGAVGLGGDQEARKVTS